MQHTRSLRIVYCIQREDLTIQVFYGTLKYYVYLFKAAKKGTKLTRGAGLYSPVASFYFNYSLK
jgi:hypothetical protein